MHTASWQRKQSYQYDVLSRLTGSELSTQGQSENFIQIREQFAFDPASNILPIASIADNKSSKILDNRVKHLEQAHQTVDYEYDDLGRVIQKRIHIKDKNAFGHIHQQLSGNHLLNQFTTCQIDLQWDEQNQLKASTSTKPDGRGGQEIIQTQYCYDPFGRRIAKQSQTYKKEIITQQIKAKIEREKADSHNSEHAVNHQLGSSMNLSLGGTTQLTGFSNLNTSRSKIIRPAKTVQTESTHLVQKQAVWNVWDGNRILQDHNGKHVFTTVYEADSFIPLARLVWLDDQLTQAANDETSLKANIEKLDQLKQIALQNIGELKGLDEGQTIPHVANDEPPKHSQHQVFWYQNDHLGTPRELTSKNGNIEWEAVYQAWGNTVTVEWQEVAQVQELNPIQLNAVEQSYLLQPHRFQGQIYDVETGLHYNRFRYYDPDAGRFISHDPIGLAGGDNSFQYAPNPVSWYDHLGLKGVSVKPAPASSPFDFYLVLDSSVYPETAGHIKDAIFNKNKDSIVTWYPDGAKPNRKDSLAGIPCKKGKDRDEWPMAAFLEGGKGASVKYIDPSDNRGAGSSIAAAIRGAGVSPMDTIKIFVK